MARFQDILNHLHLKWRFPEDREIDFQMQLVSLS